MVVTLVLKLYLLVLELYLLVLEMCLLVSELVLSIVWCFMFEKFTSSMSTLSSDPIVLFVEGYLIIIAKYNYRIILIF